MAFDIFLIEEDDMEFELANQIYVFSPDCKKGIMFYDYSPSSDVVKFSGSLQENFGVLVKKL